MKLKLKLLGLEVRKMIYSGLCYLLRHRSVAKKPLAPQKRSVYRGKTGPHHCYTIYAAARAKQPDEAFNQSVFNLVKASEERFLAGRFFKPITEALDSKQAVVTANIQQDHGRSAREHYAVIAPDHS